ncbi:dicarboxylate/amino acid:cation symporter [Lignipirellula cremea]|uniref:Proton/sodium-glutamate symport protein n=1 Tax=Lignipirellula cremea TaxID=2528010 RepID=A0A518E157_9BACT|nr:dicarboxylate/amino acid:cation symporter [Lignipirellula cremea]QDU97837.1 Proton/sodium-glutamate symport protein [Lignipirellula cremea]
MAAKELKPAEPAAATESKATAGMGGLIAIVVGIVLGALVGVFGGESMWVATGGPTEEIDKLEKTIVQKNKYAEEAEAKAAAGGEDAAQQAELAKELRLQIPVVQARLVEVQELAQTHADKMGRNGLAQQDASYASRMWWTETAAKMIQFAGEIFLRLLTLLVIPLVVTSMICGVTSLGDVRNMGRMGGGTILFYFCTTGLAVVLGLILVLLIRPGEVSDSTFAYVTENVEAKRDTGVLDTLLDVFRGKEGPDNAGAGMFPKNLIQAAASTNVLALIVFAIVFGGMLTTIGEKGQVAIDFFDAANAAIMKMVHLVMWLAPIGIFGLVAWNIAKNGGGEAFAAELGRIGWYVATVVIGLLVHAAVLCLLLWLLTGRNPLQYTLGMSRALLTAVSTASSSASLPVTMECAEENNGVSRRSTSFVLPLGATVNMDGTALYEAVAVIFIAQSLGIVLSAGKLLVIVLTATLAAVGAAGIPEAGLITMVMVLQAVGLPLEGIGAILAIDWFLDRLRTTVNVFGDSVGAAVIDRQVVEKEIAAEA